MTRPKKSADVIPDPPKVSPTKPKSAKGVPILSATTTFFLAMKAIAEGKYITKLEWNNPMTVGFLRDYLMIKIDNKDFQWIVSSGDVFGNDYIVLDPWPPDEDEWNKYIKKHNETNLLVRE